MARGPFIPLPQVLAELTLGLGLALLGANAWVLLRPALARRGIGTRGPRIPSKTRVWVNLAIGLVVATWGLGSLLSK
jgi:hypothetical protein